MAKKSASSKKTSKPAPKKKPAAKKKAAGTSAAQTAKEEALEKLNRQQSGNTKFQSVILFACAVLFFLLAFIHGNAGWYFMHRVIRGIFGFSIVIVPIILLITAYYTEKREGMSLSRRLLFSAGLTVLVSSFFQIMFIGDIGKKGFFRAIGYLYTTAADDAFQSGGVISAVLAYPFLRIIGTPGAQIIIALLLFVAIMWMLDMSMQQLWYYICWPFRKLRELWNKEPDWADDIPDTDIPGEPELPQAEEPEFLLPEQTGPKRAKVHRKGSRPAEPVPEPAADDSLESAIPDFVEDNSPLSPDLDAMIRDSYSQPQDNAPYTPAYDMDIDIPIPEDEPDNGAIVSPEELMQDPPELFTPDAETAPAETAAPAAPASEPVSQPPARPYQIPSIDFLQNGVSRAGDPAVDQEMKEKAGILVETLKSFGVTVRITGIFRGPSVTRYEIQPAAGIKVSKITGLADDIALSLAAQGVRIEAPIPGKPAIGIEVPNSHKDTVSLREILESDSFRSSKSKLAFAVGRDIAGNAVVGDIARLPHMIIAGATGSGKSVCTNSIIMSILYHATPEEVKLILIDPKIVEFTVYEGIPHLLIPVVTDPKKAAGALNWAVQEMQRRYNLFAENSVRDLGDYNAAAAQPGSGLEPMPQIVVIIDELADLMMTTSKEVEDSICRLAQKARAAGMHLIIATQRPTTDIITGLIKANIPSRIALSVMSQVDSRTILDTGGAEKLLGHGDMLYLPNGKIKPVRVQGCFTSTKEIEKVVDFIKSQTQSEYSDEIMEQVEQSIPVTKAEAKELQKAAGEPEPGSDEDVLERAIEVVVEAGQASTSSLQRRLKLGYARAARMMDELEQMGVIGSYEGAKPRKVLMTKEQLAERKMRRLQ
ncbi:DNA translocase FtsK [uncultured Ruminococcus sp.]|uniref:FtsK/SpoIIIE family DNA translocase n=1 Tax=uncultured Ruminococcus sp. TaxID=165186 RepID=UPI00265E10E6|nr:DNA translocase FtsK [uncultured Ruminococcus sp.]